MKPRLLVSVRNVDEAMAAALGGAAVIDIKEPSNGPLGRADSATIRQICKSLASEYPGRPVSAALGEITEWNLGSDSTDMADLIAYFAAGYLTPAFVKLGLAGSVLSPSRRRDSSNSFSKTTTRGQSTETPLADHSWLTQWKTTCQRITSRQDVAMPEFERPRWIAVAYADHERANSPDVESVIRGAVESGCCGVLVDTFVKDNSGLRDWLTSASLGQIRNLTRSSGLWLALAGRISLSDLAAIQAVEPDIIAVRGAVCETGSRTNSVQESLVREFVDAINSDVNSDFVESIGGDSVSHDSAGINDGDRQPDPEFPEPAPSRLRLP